MVPQIFINLLNLTMLVLKLNWNSWFWGCPILRNSQILAMVMRRMQIGNRVQTTSALSITNKAQARMQLRDTSAFKWDTTILWTTNGGFRLFQLVDNASCSQQAIDTRLVFAHRMWSCMFQSGNRGSLDMFRHVESVYCSEHGLKIRRYMEN